MLNRPRLGRNFEVLEAEFFIHKLGLDLKEVDDVRASSDGVNHFVALVGVQGLQLLGVQRA